jgi:hypothetical protein
MSAVKALFFAALLGVLAGCSSGPSERPEIGEAYAGPATLKLRREIDPQSATAAVVHHGERLGIVSRRRRFVKVRTRKGIEGWTDMRQLLASDQMAALNQLAETARRLPSQGAATVYEPLNVHTEANRQAPSFYQIKEHELCDVVEQELSPRLPFETKTVLPPTPKKEPVRKPKAEEGRIPRLSPPPPPKPPDNWLDLSKWPPAPPEPPKEEDPSKPVPTDDWSLVRLKNGRAGWVLTSQLKMNIPDEVAQYSEGHRIASYFAMADIKDGDQLRHHWLWTTLSAPRVPYQFDSFRYFIWNVRHHRYETAYVQRDLKGYYPVEVHPVQATFGKRQETFPGFTLIVEEGGVRYKKTYAYEYYLVKLVSKEQVETPPSAVPGNAAPTPPPQNKPAETGLGAKWKSLKERWFGKR